MRRLYYLDDDAALTLNLVRQLPGVGDTYEDAIAALRAQWEAAKGPLPLGSAVSRDEITAAFLKKRGDPGYSELYDLNAEGRVTSADQLLAVALDFPQSPTAPPARNALLQPFSHVAYCNTPLGRDRKLTKINLGTRRGVELEYIMVDPGAPMRSVQLNGLWPANCAGGAEKAKVHVADGYRIPDGYAPNNCAAGLGADGDTVHEFQYAARCSDTGYVACGHYHRSHSLRGDASPDIYTNHGGSGISALAGCLRKWEAAPGTAIEHSLKLTVNAWLLGRGPADKGYRWPASRADGGWDTPGGDSEYRGPVRDFCMGALVCLPDTFNLAVLTTEFGQRIGRAFRDFGARVVDIHPSNWTDCWINAEAGVNVPDADMALIYSNLFVVTDDGKATPGGAGPRVRALLPPL